MIGKLLLKSTLLMALGVLAFPLQADGNREARDRMIGKLFLMVEEAPKHAFSVHPMQFFILGSDLGGSFFENTNLRLAKEASRSFTNRFDRPVWFFENRDGPSEGLLVTVLGTDHRLVTRLTSRENDAFWSRMINEACAINGASIQERGYEFGNCIKMYDNMDTPENGIYTRAFSSLTHSSGPQSSIIEQGIHLFVHAGFYFGVMQYQHKIFTPPGKLTAEAFNEGNPFENRRDFAVSVIRNSEF